MLLLLQVSMFSPAAKAGISPGNTILVINDWQIEAMDKPQVYGPQATLGQSRTRRT